MSFFKDIQLRAKSNAKKIILPETEDERILKAGIIAEQEGFAKISFVGDTKKVLSDINRLISEDPNLKLDKNIEIFDIYDEKLKSNLAHELYILRQHKGISLEDAYKMLDDKIYFAMMLLKTGYANGLVAGAINSTANVLRPALQIIKTKENAKFVSGFFVMELPNSFFGEKGVLIYSDASLVENPDEEQLAEIAIQASKSFKSLLIAEPKVAMLSYSTKGSATSDLTTKVINATKIAKEKDSNLVIDGELQLDSAIIPEISKTKAPDSIIKGEANVLIFPDINAGNIRIQINTKTSRS